MSQEWVQFTESWDHIHTVRATSVLSIVWYNPNYIKITLSTKEESGGNHYYKISEADAIRIATEMGAPNPVPTIKE